MEDRYRRLHYDPNLGPYWTPPSKAVVVPSARLKKHVPAFPKKKSSKDKTDIFDIPPYLKQYKDKYGSVSAHSTSAIYGALRAPHCHALYNPSDVWYSSVRSLNSRPREVVYPMEAYDWREPVYEDLQREACPPEMLRARPPCFCVISRRPLPGSKISTRTPPRCKYCITKSVPSMKKNIPEKLKLLAVSEENGEDVSKPREASDRMAGYKKKVIGSGRSSKSARYGKNGLSGSVSDTGKVSRKSILECDVTAYDLIKKVAKSPPVSEVDSEDVDDDLNDNAILKSNSRSRQGKKNGKVKSREAEHKLPSPSSSTKKSKSRNAQNENSVYTDASSVRIGGQRVFTNHQNHHTPDIKEDQLETEPPVHNGGDDSCYARWRQKISASDESICIPEPDYDFSDDNENNVDNSSIRDVKFTYSPPLVRKPSIRRSGLGNSREISKSMSSLLSEDTETHTCNYPVAAPVSPSEEKDEWIMPREEEPCMSRPEGREHIIMHHYSSDHSSDEEPVSPLREERTSQMESSVSGDVLHYKESSTYESLSSSDSGSNGGTMSSDYLTWTSSSSGELKSILKKKKKREGPVICEKEDTPSTVFTPNTKDCSNSTSSSSKKQVQFRSTSDDNIFVELIRNEDLQTSNVKDNAEGVHDYAQINQGNGKESGSYCFDNFSFDSNAEKSGAYKCVIDDDDKIYQTLKETYDDGRTSHGPFFESKENTPCKGSSDERKSDFLSKEDWCNERTFANSPPTVQTNNSSSPQKFSINELPSDSSALGNGVGAEASVPEVTSSLTFPCRSSSLEDIRAASRSSKKESKRRNGSRRRTTLPKRRFSDLHLHIILCPKRSVLCGDTSSSDDIPLTNSRGHRSLPESPSELDDESTFCFDFLEKSSKEKGHSSSRSTFYVPVDGSVTQEAANDLHHKPQGVPEGSSPIKLDRLEDCIVPPSGDGSYHHYSASDEDQLLDTGESDIEGIASPLQEDTDEDILENEYENLDPIYEELSDVSNSSKRITVLDSPQKSFFEGASKTDILSYLEDAKERGLEGLSEDEIKVITEEDEEDDAKTGPEDEETADTKLVLTKIDPSQETPLSEGENAVSSLEITPESSLQEAIKPGRTTSAEIERNDSGVGTETSKPSRISKLHSTDNEEQLCADCDHQVEPQEDEASGLLFSPLVCKKCELRRCERKEIIIEIVDTELKYGRDLRIIKEEFYRPMEVAGLLGKEQLLSVFLNLDELLSVNTKFSEKLQDALDIAMEHGDEDYTTVNIGKLFLETSSMLHAFETYCVKQASASVLLNNLEKEKELLRIFLRVSQMENTLLRRMNLPAFLMVPVQRVTRYPLLLSRLHKVTPYQHKDREALKEAQQKVELHLEHINQQTKGVGGTKIWRRISNISASHRRLGNLQDIGNIKLRKMALEVLNWKQDEVRFVMAGKLLFTQITDYPWNKKGRTIKFTTLHALLVAQGKPNANYRPESAADNSVLFPRNTGIRDASLLLMKEKNGRFVAVRDPLYLGSCVISTESETDDVFEIQEYTTKEAYLLKGENKKDTKEWLRQLRYHAKDLGSWRRRRNALANIMINGMIRH